MTFRYFHATIRIVKKWQKQQNGAVWKKKGPHGTYLSGYVEINGEQHRVTLFPNGYKKHANQPDFLIYKPFADSQN